MHVTWFQAFNQTFELVKNPDRREAIHAAPSLRKLGYARVSLTKSGSVYLWDGTADMHKVVAKYIPDAVVDDGILYVVGTPKVDSLSGATWPTSIAGYSLG